MSMIKKIQNDKSVPIKAMITGQTKRGKTSLLYTLPEETTLFMNLEGGDQSVKDWKGDQITPTTWEGVIGTSVWMFGPDKKHKDGFYSEKNFDNLCRKLGEPSQARKYTDLFIDSFSVASRWAKDWAEDNVPKLSGKDNTWGVYGAIADELIQWASYLQRYGTINVWLIGLLDQKTDKQNFVHYEMQIEGQKAKEVLPGIFDRLMVLDYLVDKKGKEVIDEKGNPYRALYCQGISPQGFKTGQRGGMLDNIEPPHLGRIIEKIKNGDSKSVLNFDLPKGE